MAGDFKRVFRLGRFSKSDARSSVNEEFEHHLDLCVSELVDQGWNADEARREATRQFGDLDAARAYCEDMQTRRDAVERRAMSFEEMWQDLKYAFRTLIKAPGYAGLVVVTLGFGIAANTTIFSVMNPYFFRTLPFERPDELVHVTQVDPVTGWHMGRFSLPTYEDWRARARSFDQLGAYTYQDSNVTGPEGPEAISTSEISDNMFEILGAQALYGRTFGSGEGGPGAEPVVVLGHGFWQRRYTGDLGVLGRAITIDGLPYTVIGIMPPDFTFPFGGVRMWMPIRDDATTMSRTGAPYLLVGRMADGWTHDRVDTELTGIQQELAALHPEGDGQWSGVTVLPIRQALNFAWDILTVSFSILLGAVIFVLMIACVNVASLNLARAGSRTREIAVRTALGASRSRVVRQLLTESLVLAAFGGALGIALAYMMAGFIGPVIPEDLYKIGDVTVDRTVLAFSLLVTLATPFLFGLAPAVSATRKDLTTGLKEGAKGSGGLSSSRGRRALVVVQVSLAVILTTGAGLMVRSFASVQRLDLGFDADRVLAVTVRPPESAYSFEELKQYVGRAIEELEALPGVSSASATLYIPLNNETSSPQFVPSELAGIPANEWPTAVTNRAYPGYFETMGIPLFAGRDFNEGDNPDGARVAIVNEALAARYWPNESAVGRTIMVGTPTDATTYTVVGVAGGVMHEALTRDDDRAQLYLSAAQSSFRRHILVVRTEGEPSALISQARSTLMGIDPDLPLTLRPISVVVDQSQLQWSLGSAFLAVFGGGALLLATLGIYGLISFTVSQRQRELGVRIAMGATVGQIRSIVVGDALKLTSVGLGVGLIASLSLGPLLAEALFGVSPFDPVTLVGVLFLFALVAALASIIPAQRAAQTDPISVLRSE